MRLLIKATMSRKGLVPVKKMVSRKGKPFMQTFYVRPDQAPTKPTAIHHQDLPALPAPVPKAVGPKGDDRFYIARPVTKEGEPDVPTGETEAVRIPAKAVKGTFKKFGYTFVVHHTIDRANKIEAKGFTVTEAITGKRVTVNETNESVEDFEKRVNTLLDNIGEEKAKSVIDAVNPLTETTIRTIEDTEDFYMEVPITNDDIKRATDHIFKVIMSYDDVDIRQDVSDWIEGHLKTNTDVEVFINDTSDANEEDFTIAVEGDMYMYEATQTLEALVYIEGAVDDSTVDFDTVKQWWHDQAFPELREVELYIGDSNDYGEVEESEALAWMVSNDKSITQTEEYVQEQLDNYKEEATEGELDEYFEFNDRNDIHWDAESLKNIGRWVDGSVVKSARKTVKDADDNRRQGLDPGTVSYNQIGETVLEHMSLAEYDEVYRGTTNDAWRTAKIGDVMPLGMASFSNQSGQAQGFASKQGTVIILTNSRTDESKKIMGIDIEQLIEDVGNESGSAATASGINEHSHEHEFIVRAPSIRITKIEPEGPSISDAYYTVYAEVADMSLLKSMQNVFDDRITRMEAIFDEPLHRTVE